LFDSLGKQHVKFCIRFGDFIVICSFIESFTDIKSRKEEDMCNTTEQIKIESHDNVKMENVDIENSSPVKKPDSDVEIGSPVKKMEVDVH
jgi:hypothetical protein